MNIEVTLTKDERDVLAENEIIEQDFIGSITSEFASKMRTETQKAKDKVFAEVTFSKFKTNITS